MFLTRPETLFLNQLTQGEIVKRSKFDNIDHRMRQRMKQHGYAEVLRNPVRWRITLSGRTALEMNAGRLAPVRQPFIEEMT